MFEEDLKDELDSVATVYFDLVPYADISTPYCVVMRTNTEYYVCSGGDVQGKNTTYQLSIIESTPLLAITTADSIETSIDTLDYNIIKRNRTSGSISPDDGDNTGLYLQVIDIEVQI